MKLTTAQVARVKALENSAGKVLPHRLVADAKRPASPLHGLFPWQLRVAAERYWLHLAREIIGSVTYEVTRHNVIVRLPLYVNLPGAEGRGYQRVEALKDNPEQARVSLVYTLEVAAGHLRRAYDLASPLGLAGEIDKLLAEVAGVQRIAQRKKAA